MRIPLRKENRRHEVAIRVEKVTRMTKCARDTLKRRPKPPPELPMPLFLRELRHRGKMYIHEMKPEEKKMAGKSQVHP